MTKMARQIEIKAKTQFEQERRLLATCAHHSLTLFPYGSLYIHAHIPLTESFMTPNFGIKKIRFLQRIVWFSRAASSFFFPVDNIANVRHQRNNRKGIDQR